MSSSNGSSGFDTVRIKRLAFGIRFQQQLGLEDILGTVVDDILALPGFGPDRFDTTLFAGDGGKTLLNEKQGEAIQLARGDAIFQTEQECSVADISPLADEFVDNVWAAVCKRAPRSPNALRYGCLINFVVPEEWNPIRAILNAEPAETSEFDLRYVRRLPTEGGLSSRDVSDFRNAIFNLRTRKNKTVALIDFQHVFDPAVSYDRLRKEWPFTRFVEKAIAYYRVQGWEFIRNRLERLARAA